MKNFTVKILIIFGLTAAGIIWNGNVFSPAKGIIAKADARMGRPATPVSYAGVARRTTVRVATPGVGGPANRGGPVNRVGRR